MHLSLRHPALILIFIVVGAACSGETGSAADPSTTDPGLDSAVAADASADGASTPESTLCGPCDANDQCAGGGAGAVCVDGASTGSFCGVACDDAAPCPTGYACTDVKDVSGAAVKQCTPTGAACVCSAEAIAKGASTPCSTDKAGKMCPGTISCQADGSLTACVAADPTKETCDGLDNDCDGKVDGDVACDDGKACTKDACDAASKACSNTPEDGACDDKNACTTDTCDATAGCQHKPIAGPSDDNNVCTTGEVCKDGQCDPAKTTDCDDSDDCTTDTCDANTGLCKHADIAGCGLPAAKSCKGKCGEYNADWACQCDSACKQYSDCCEDIDKVCAAKCTSDTQCNDSSVCTDDKCDVATGKCSNTALADDSPCDDKEVCTTEKCVAGQCAVTPKPDATDCGDGNKCVEAACINGGCAKASKSCDDKDSCTTDSCTTADGTCKHAAKAAGATCNDGQSCTTTDKCDAAGKCAGVAKNDGDSCSDGYSCTTKDRCQSGACVGTPDDTPCDDKNSCTTDACGGKGETSSGCVFQPIKDGAECQDGDVCTVSDVCKAGACIGVMKCPTLFFDTFECGNKTGWTLSKPVGSVGWGIDGTPAAPGAFSAACSLNYNDGKSYPGQTAGTATSKPFKMPASGAVAIALQTWDSMEGSSNYDKRLIQASPDGFVKEITSVQVPNSLPKSQWSLFKTKLDKYLGQDVQLRLSFDSVDAVSNSGPGWFVDDLRVVIAQLPKDLTCTVDHDCPFDGDPCTGQTCKAGKCVAGFSAAKCEDGDLCTDGDTCKDGACVGGGETNCDDANVCTIDSCDKAKGCKYANNEEPCSDGDSCTDPDVCFGGACTATPNSCHDNNPCTTDSCDPQTGKCAHTKIAACEQKGMKVPWETKFDCATPKEESWDPEGAGGGPVWAIDDNPNPPSFKSPQCSLNFNDGKNIGCPNGAKLSPKIGVEGSAWSPYFDATGVTPGAQLAARFQLAGSWSASTGHLAIEGSVDNGKTWKLLLEPAPGSAKDWSLVQLDLADYVGKFFQLRLHFWTTSCSTAYSGPFVDDFKIWDATCKQDGDCDDSNACTEDSCDVATGKCGHNNKKASTACDDGNSCTSDEICNSSGKCGGGTAKVCDDKNPCTNDSCNPGTGDCKYESKTADTICSDGNACTNKDKCDSAGKCVGLATASGSACSDANTCTSSDKCDGQGACLGTPVAAGAGSCSDGNDCTDQDKCDGGGICVGQPKQGGSACNDSDPCTKDTCDGGGDCNDKEDEAKCDDKDPCTLDACIKKSTVSSTCKHSASPDGAKCDDGTPCTESDTCAGGKCIGTGICNFKVVSTGKFDCGSADWTLKPVGGAGKVGWQIDGLPNPPGYKSEKCSLNFNNDKDFPGDVTGSAVSKAMAIPAAAVDATLSVWSYHGVEASKGYDQRYIEVSDDDFAKSIQSVLLDNGADIKVWAEAKVSLTQWLGKSVKVRFRFDTVDSANNEGPGWFVDDMTVNVGTKK